MAAGEVHLQPEQIHLSLGSDPSQMVVTWLTVNKTATPQVKYGLASGSPEFNKQQNGYSTLYVDGGTEQRTMYIHRAVMVDLTPGAPYYYHVGSADGWSAVFWYKAQRNDTAFAPTLAVYGDLGKSSVIVQLVQNFSCFDAIYFLFQSRYPFPLTKILRYANSSVDSTR